VKIPLPGFCGRYGAFVCVYLSARARVEGRGVVVAVTVPRFRACFTVWRLFSGSLGGDCRRPVSAAFPRVFGGVDIRNLLRDFLEETRKALKDI